MNSEERQARRIELLRQGQAADRSWAAARDALDGRAAVRPAVPAQAPSEEERRAADLPFLAQAEQREQREADHWARTRRADRERQGSARIYGAIRDAQGRDVADEWLAAQ